jgi:hypothetical protein
MQRRYLRDNRGVDPNVVDGSFQTLQIQYPPDRSAYVTIVPLSLGKFELGLFGRFPDGGFVDRKVAFNVEPPQKPPDKLIVSQGALPKYEAKHIVIALTGDNPHDDLGIFAKYEGLDTLVDIDTSFVTFRVTSRDQVDPIHLDQQTGLLTPIHPGQALVETFFGGRRDLTCVDVEEAMTPGRSYFEKNCQQLLSPGEKLGPQE